MDSTDEGNDRHGKYLRSMHGYIKQAEYSSLYQELSNVQSDCIVMMQNKTMVVQEFDR